MNIKVVKLNKKVSLPRYQHKDDSCMDLVNAGKDIVLKPFSRALIPVGISVEIPVGYELQIRPRSGLALKKGLTVLNTPGTIDSGYRGEIGVILFNASDRAVKIKHAERIAQLALCKVERIEWIEVKKLSSTKRGAKGFGSTGR